MMSKLLFQNIKCDKLCSLIFAACWCHGAVECHCVRLSHIKPRYYDVDYGGDDAQSEDHIIQYVGYILMLWFVDVERRA